MDPHQYCQDKAAASGSSFYYSFRFLPENRRLAITALYAFCREVDDIVDECSDANVALTKLNWWRQEIKDLFQGQPHHPVSHALVPAIQEFNLPAEQFQEIIDGMEMDLTMHRYEDFKSLRLYCHRVAGVVGELSAIIFGYTERGTLRYAADLGLAFQLTNIIRDVGEDARRNRIYLPMDELAKFNVPASDILNARQTDNFKQLMEFQYQRAQEFYDLAFSELPQADRKTQKTGLVMAAIYRTLLEEIRNDGYLVLTQRTALTPVRKLWIAWRTWMKG
ncbi:presqualene diphosphate synthase HpnD [Sulfuriferula nivalis]|uniref:Phytoene synthase n=1 Tax=Sulfuriferula nivalis TaxID=2675298 RepID=A0A809S9P0_9PROT|nr:presqualene diphosphate synthase HpnD [Sulfuriferula nivalis]BBP01062.1 phytoene synthase [Sulfuriferula nivalis]